MEQDLLANTKNKLTRKDVAKPNSFKRGFHSKASTIWIVSKLGKNFYCTTHKYKDTGYLTYKPPPFLRLNFINLELFDIGGG